MAHHKTKRDVIRLAKTLGATLYINIDRDPLDVELVAPTGHYWKDDPVVHALVGHQHPCERAGDVWDDLYDRASGGVISCDDMESHCTDCDFWKEN